MTYRWHSHVYPECGKFRLPASLGKVDILEVHILKVQDHDGDDEYDHDDDDDRLIYHHHDIDEFAMGGDDGDDYNDNSNGDVDDEYERLWMLF